MQHAVINVVLLIIYLSVGSSLGMAQENAFKHPLAPSDTSSPQATLFSFIEACNELYDLAATEKSNKEFATNFLPAAARIRDCLDLSGLTSELRDTVGIESGVYLKEVLDRIKLPVAEDIPDILEAETGTRAEWLIPGTRLKIIKLQESVYVFAADTVRQAATTYSSVRQLPYRTEGPKVSPGFHDRYVALTKRQPQLKADTSSPRGTLNVFLNSTNQVFDHVRKKKFLDRADPELLSVVTQAFRCLDLSAVPEYSRDYYAAEASVCLKEILDRVEIPSIEEIPGAEDVQNSSEGEPLSGWQIPNTKITIGRMLDGPRRGEYLFTAETVQNCVAMYEELKSRPYRTQGPSVSAGFHDWYLSSPASQTVAKWLDTMPDWFRNRLFSLAIWQWIGLVLALVLSISTMFFLYWKGMSSSERMREKNLYLYWLTLSFSIFAMLIPLAFNYVVWYFLTIRGSALYTLEFSANLAFLLSLIVVILAGSNRLADSTVVLRRPSSRKLDATLVQILFRVAGIIAAAIVFLEGGRYLGFPLTTLLASAGIGGLAVAFSAQGMLKGFFGTVTILLDRPYSVGDRITVKGQDGTVEEIGLRSTKIREFLTNHLITIPNDQVAEVEIINIGRRKHIRRKLDLHIPLDTPYEKIEAAIEIIRGVLDNHEGMDPEYAPQVYFNEFNADSFNIWVNYWYTPPDLWRFNAFNERVNLMIFRAFEEHGIQFSLPLRHSYWKQDNAQGPLPIELFNAGAKDGDSNQVHDLHRGNLPPR